tara:strand:- start:57 stop:386 length:330 start_codon:yes stop_codon:yes gene_type:complete
MLTRFINDRHYIDLTNYITKGVIIMDINTMIREASVSDMFFNTDHINYRKVFDKSMKESGVAPSYAEIEQSLCEDAEAFLLWASPIIEIINKGKIPTTSELASDFLARL